MQVGSVGLAPPKINPQNNQTNNISFSDYRNTQKEVLEKITSKEILLHFLGLTYILQAPNKDSLIEKLISFIDYLSYENHNPPPFENELYKEYLKVRFNFSDENAKKLLALCQPSHAIPLFNVPISLAVFSDDLYTKSASTIRQYLNQYFPYHKQCPKGREDYISERAYDINKDISLTALCNFTNNDSLDTLQTFLNRILFNEENYDVKNFKEIKNNRYFGLLSEHQKDYLLMHIHIFTRALSVMEKILQLENMKDLANDKDFQSLTPEYQRLIKTKLSECIDIADTPDKLQQIYSEAAQKAKQTNETVITVLMNTINNLSLPFNNIKIMITNKLIKLLEEDQIFEKKITDANLKEFFKLNVDRRNIVLKKLDPNYKNIDTYNFETFGTIQDEYTKLRTEIDENPTISDSIKNELKSEHEKIQLTKMPNAVIQLIPFIAIMIRIIAEGKEIKNLKTKISTTIKQLEKVKSNLMVDEVSASIDNLTKDTKLNLLNKPDFTKHDDAIQQLQKLLDTNVTNIKDFTKAALDTIESVNNLLQNAKQQISH